eukprot:NODE_8532_length_1489_cov_2.731278.p1 GENE.NODE_8532_length_1489_cov_2.731278~~NODE_8532_length_1489_cov_2.731278.p1  ORF type:complete len:317 (-),score=56.39 NODE_8532_length_1489_cov_2.731278:425-1375(-)
MPMPEVTTTDGSSGNCHAEPLLGTGDKTLTFSDNTSGRGPARTVAHFLVTLILVSRPGFYHFTGFTYIIPFARDPSALLSTRALLGLAFVIFPMNLLVYSMNDIKDVDIDKMNPRKGGLHGAQASAADLRICLAVALASVVLVPPLLTGDLLWSFCWSGIGILSNWAYNFGPQLSRVPVLDMVPPLGYLLTIPFSNKVNAGTGESPMFILFITLVVFRTQLWFQRYDLVADAAAGKRTTAVCIGSPASVVGTLFFLASELAAAHTWGCFSAQVWVGYSTFVFVLELATGNRNISLALMFLGGFVAVIPFWQCLAVA